MGIEEFVTEKVKMLESGFSKEQIRRECWTFALLEGAGSLTIEAIVFNSMDLYAEILRRRNRN